MVDALVAVSVFQHHFPSMLAMECDGEDDLGIVCMFDARSFRFSLFVHFFIPLRGLILVRGCYCCSGKMKP
jgi:hypothetical protein